MERFRCMVSVVILLAVALVFVGCAKPPDAEKAAAKAAMDAAVSAGADKYAASDFSAARGVWDTAESQMNEKKYKEAKQSYTDAKAGFEKAAAGVEAGKKAMTEEATAAVTALEEQWKNLEATAKKLQKNMKDKKEAWDADSKTMADGIKAAKEMIPTDPAGAKAKTTEIKAIADKWDATFKELSEPAAKK